MITAQVQAHRTSRSTIANPIRSLIPWRIKELAFHQDGDIMLGAQSIEPNQWRLTDRLRDVVKDATHGRPPV